MILKWSKLLHRYFGSVQKIYLKLILYYGAKFVILILILTHLQNSINLEILFAIMFIFTRSNLDLLVQTLY
jgi:hypothetical protein